MAYPVEPIPPPPGVTRDDYWQSMIGLKYERYSKEESGWKHEIRKILDVTKNGIYYEVIKPVSTGTYVGWDERETHIVDWKSWYKWVRLARELT